MTARVLPHNLDAERAVLGAVLIEPETYDAVAAVLAPGHFFREAHARTFAAFGRLAAASQPIDGLVVVEELRRSGDLETVGGPAYVLGLMDGVPRGQNIEAYAQIVRDKASLRALVDVGNRILTDAYGDDALVDELVDRAERLVMEAGRTQVRGGDFLLAGDWMTEVMGQVEHAYHTKRIVTGVPTGLPGLDRMTRGLQPADLVYIGARPSAGKALALDTLLPTPSGWTTMGAISVGDRLFDEQGQSCSVTHVTPIYMGDKCYEVEFSDGTKVTTDADHRWFAFDHSAWKSFRGRKVTKASASQRRASLARDQSSRHKHPRVVTTQEMLDEGLMADGGRRQNWHVPVAQPLDLPHADLPVDPYVLGCWLGDGTTSSASMTIGDADIEHFVGQFEAAGYRLVPRKAKLIYSTAPVAGTGQWWSYTGPNRHLARELRGLGLLGKRRKFIPEMYLRASTAQRLALLQGLMDTDGTADPRHGAVEIVLSNLELLTQIRELVCSLGQRARTITAKPATLNGRIFPAWRLAWSPTAVTFRMQRKAALAPTRSHHRFTTRVTKRSVMAIRPVPSVPVRCISVDSPNRLYLATESMIPTHNTSLMLQMALHASQHVMTGVVSAEMSRRSIGMRAVSLESRIDAFRVQTGQLSDSEVQHVSRAIGRLSELRLAVDDASGQTASSIRAKVRRLAMRHGLGIVFIDYMQLLRMPDGRAYENRNLELSVISAGLKDLAKELDIPVVVLSQLSRDTAKGNRRPQLHDLRDSGSLEQDADVVLLLHRPGQQDGAYQPGEEAELIIAKQRNGPVGMVPLYFVADQMRFAERARDAA